MRGLLGGRVVDWNSGVFSLSHVISYPARPARVPKVVETLITSDRGDYYHVTNLGLAHFRPIDAPANNDKVHHGAVLRTYAEPAEFIDANGARYSVELEVTRPTPYVISRPGGLSRTGLTKSAHLVRLELDDRGLGGSAPIIESVTVLDGTPAFPAELDAAYRSVWEHYASDARGAELTVAFDEKATLATFDTRTKEWAKQVQPTGKVESSERRYVHSNPTYTWDANAKTLAVTFAHETHVIQTKIIRYPNPELRNFYCPPGVPCAVPPDTLAHVLELEYVIAFTASYRIEGDGRITRASPTQARLHVAR
ncbi:MAG: hypothetical protein SFX73_01685 [Kofleriaceae bacterium]|nr:hypothetical protein [Kofleriaceae bacterium]